MCASFGLHLAFTGVSTHASAPEKGINPALAIAEIICELKNITDPSQYKGMVMCTVIHAELGTKGAYGVAASTGSVSVTCRAEYDEDMTKLENRILDFCNDTAVKHKLKSEVSKHDCFPATVNQKYGADKVRSIARDLGMPITELKDAIRGSEDYGHYLKMIPGAFFFLGAGNCPPVHSIDYDFPDDIIETGVEFFRALALAQ